MKWNCIKGVTDIDLKNTCSRWTSDSTNYFLILKTQHFVLFSVSSESLSMSICKRFWNEHDQFSSSGYALVLCWIYRNKPSVSIRIHIFYQAISQRRSDGLAPWVRSRGLAAQDHASQQRALLIFAGWLRSSQVWFARCHIDIRVDNTTLLDWITASLTNF